MILDNSDLNSKLVYLIANIVPRPTDLSNVEFDGHINTSLEALATILSAKCVYLISLADDTPDLSGLFAWPSGKPSTSGDSTIADLEKDCRRIYQNTGGLDFIRTIDFDKSDCYNIKHIAELCGCSEALIISIGKAGDPKGRLIVGFESADKMPSSDSAPLLELYGQVLIERYRCWLIDEEKLGFLRDIVENAPEVVYSTDENGTIDFISPEARAPQGLFGFDIIGSNLEDLFHPDDMPSIKQAFEDFKNGQHAKFDIEIRLLSDSPKMRWVRTAIRPVYRKGKFAGISGLLMDITARVFADRALKESEERYRAVWDSSPVGICLTDSNGVYLYVNPAYCRIYGYSADELIGFPFYEKLLPPGLANAAIERHNGLFALGKPILPGEIEFIKKNGERIWIEYTGDFIWDQGMPRYLVSMNMDVSKRKLMEIALSISEKNYGIIIENSSDLILSVQEDGEILLSNPAAAEFLGFEPNELEGKNIRDVYPPEIAEKQMSAVARVISANASIELEEMIVYRGSKKWFKTGIHPIIDRQSGLSAAQIIAADITEYKLRLSRNEAILKLFDNLRATTDIDRCLEFACETIVGVGLYARAVFTIHDQDGKIEHLGQVGIPEEIVENARGAPPISQEIREKMLDAKFKLSRSFFVPAAAGLNYGAEKRYIPQEMGNSDNPGKWQAGDELFVPIYDESGSYMGWLSVDSPFNGLRPTKDSIAILEEITDIVAQHIREIISRNSLSMERLRLEEKNVAIKEVMATVAREKLKEKNQIIEQIEKVTKPFLDKLLDSPGNINEHHLNILKKNIENFLYSDGRYHKGLSDLSARELEICELIKDDNDSNAIAKQLSISPGTVRKHREIIRKKLGIAHKPINLASYLKSL